MTVISDLFNALENIIIGLASALKEALNSIVLVFYDEGFTVLGALLLIGFGLFFVMFAWRVIQGLIRR